MPRSKIAREDEQRIVRNKAKTLSDSRKSVARIRCCVHARAGGRGPLYGWLGVYGRAVVSRLNGKPMLYSPEGFSGVAARRSTSSALNGSLRKPALTSRDRRALRSPGRAT